MQTIKMLKAEAHLSNLVEQAGKDEPSIIAKANKPLVKVRSIATPKAKTKLGFMKGLIKVPDDFDQMGSKEIESMFYRAHQATRKRSTLQREKG
jgi:antitoxin (DNA-binding transcriptional repressor) of toxin-antitoxin stability system